MSFQLSLSTESVSAAYPDQPLFVTSTSTVGEVIQLLRAQKTGSVMVCDGACGEEGKTCNKLLGIFTERDALRYMALMSAGKDGGAGKNNGAGKNGGTGKDGGILDQPMTAAMSTTLTTLQTDTNMGEAIKLMSEGGFRHLPILGADGAPTGMETVYGIVHYLVDHFPQTIYNLPPNPGSVPSEREGA